MSVPMETITSEFASAVEAGENFAWIRDGDLLALTCTALGDANFANAFSTRLGGVSPTPAAALNLANFDHDRADNIHENRRRFVSLLADRAPRPSSWQLMTLVQTHGAEIHAVNSAAEIEPDRARADALVTPLAGVLLGVKTADCVPVLIGDSRTGACAAIHAGWRGTLADIVALTVERMRREYKSRADDLRVAIGPAARGCCYEVGPEVIGFFRGKYADAESLFAATDAGRALIDLHEANRRQLIAAGLDPENIHVADRWCTMCRTDLFFSHRRDGAHSAGRSLSVIGRVS